MNDHSVDAMIYAWRVMKEKEVTMEYIDFGKVVNVSASVPVATDDTVYHIIIDFVPNRPAIFDSFHTDMGKILECPDGYVLCHVGDITKTQDELLKLKDRVKELEEQIVNEKRKESEKVNRLDDSCIYWNDRFTSVMTDFRKVLTANGIGFSLKEIDSDGNWKVVIDIPELNEAKKKISELESKLADSKSNETYWRDRKEEEEDYHHYWLHTYNMAVAHAANEGVRIFITGEDKENNVGVILVKNEKAEELEAKIGELKKELEDLKSKKVAKCTMEISGGKVSFIYTYMDGHNESACMVDGVDAESLSRGAIPKCKACKNHRYFTNSGHCCLLPDSKHIFPGLFHVNSLTEEEAEGPACDKFEARKE